MTQEPRSVKPQPLKRSTIRLPEGASPCSNSRWFRDDSRKSEGWYQRLIKKTGEAVEGATNRKTLRGLMKAIEVDPERVNQLVCLINLAVVGTTWRHVGDYGQPGDDVHLERRIAEDRASTWNHELMERLIAAYEDAWEAQFVERHGFTEEEWFAKLRAA